MSAHRHETMTPAARILALLACVFSLAIHAASPDELLEPDKAFRFSARALDDATLEVRYQIADGYYMYRDKFRFAAEPGGVSLGAAQFPKGEIKTDEFFGKMETYRRDLRIRVPIDASAAKDRIKLLVTSQGCADFGVCYIPQVQSAEVRLAAYSSPASPSSGGGSFFGSRSVPPAWADDVQAASGSDERIAALFQSGSAWLVLASFFGFGILLAFTPCMLPMIPILSGIIVGEGRELGKLRALVLSLAYVLGMAVTYAAAGVAAGFSGSILAAALQNPWVLSAFALVFVWLALSMFGLHDLTLPGFLHQRLSGAHHKLQGGRVVSVALMGMLSAVIVSPCVAAPLAGALLYISQTRDALQGGAALFAMALGMGAPLLVVGVSEGALLPKSGPWMKTVKKFFGVLLLAVAIWIVSPVLPGLVAMFAWAALLIGTGVFLRALDLLQHDAPVSARLGKVLGLVALLAGAAVLAGALAGSRDPLAPLEAFRAGGEAKGVKFERVKTLAELETRLAKVGKPAMLDFYADWCVSCKEMERYTFSKPQVQAKMNGMLLLQVDVTANNADDKALLRRFRLFGPPGIIFFDKSGREIPGLRVIGFQPADRFARTLDLAAIY